MSRVLLGVICGLVFGVIDIGIMLPMSFLDKNRVDLWASYAVIHSKEGEPISK